jgi:betaine lipid synthase
LLFSVNIKSQIMAIRDLLTIPQEPLVQVGLAGSLLVLFLVFIFVASSVDAEKHSGPLATLAAYARFAYGCFIKPHSGDVTGNQQDALESFYKAQANVYDTTRARLLHGREDMLSLAASQLRDTDFQGRKPIWVDVSQQCHEG